MSKLGEWGVAASRCPLCLGRRLSRHLPAVSPSGNTRSESFRCTSSEYGHHPEILRCQDCRLVFLAERPTAERLAQLYGDVEDPLYEQEESGRIATFNAHLERLERVVGRPNHRQLLDVGAYTGVAVEVAAGRGWEATGVDPCRWAVESGRRRGRRLVEGTPDDPAVRDLGLFDVITLWDVIEHVADPGAVLTAVRDRLRPGGYVAVHTMDVDSLFARITGKRWPWYMEMHLFYFSPSTLARLLGIVGFEVVHVEHRGRTVSVGYLTSRLAALVPWVGKPCHALIQRTPLAHRLVRIGFGDLFTVVARRPVAEARDDSAAHPLAEVAAHRSR